MGLDPEDHRRTSHAHQTLQKSRSGESEQRPPRMQPLAWLGTPQDDCQRHRQHDASDHLANPDRWQTLQRSQCSHPQRQPEQSQHGGKSDFARADRAAEFPNAPQILRNRRHQQRYLSLGDRKSAPQQQGDDQQPRRKSRGRLHENPETKHHRKQHQPRTARDPAESRRHTIISKPKQRETSELGEERETSSDSGSSRDGGNR